MTALQGWTPLAYHSISGYRGSMVLVVKPSGKGFYGQVINVTPAYVELQNGNFKNLVRFGPPAMFTQVHVPGLNLPMVGSPRLFP